MSRTRTSALTLVAAVAAVSTAVVGTVATATPTHATESSRAAESTLSIRVPHSRIEAGDTTRVLGSLHIRGPLDPAGRTVTLEARSAGATGFTPVGTDVAGPRGGVRLEVAPTVTTRYRWTYAGAEDARPSHSGVARVVIVEDQHGGHRLATSLSIRAAHRVVGPTAATSSAAGCGPTASGSGTASSTCSAAPRATRAGRWRARTSPTGLARCSSWCSRPCARRTGWRSRAPRCSTPRTAESSASVSGRSSPPRRRPT